jgi:arsenate reductase (thioredoxin)
MVCDETDAGCPAVGGASLRLSLPFADPKSFDGTPEEAARYAERRDDMGRLLMWVMEQARRRPG